MLAPPPLPIGARPDPQEWQMMLELKDIRSEVDRISALVDGWIAAGGVSGIERDLLLDRLRGLYETVRFASEADRLPAANALPRAGFEAEKADAAPEHSPEPESAVQEEFAVIDLDVIPFDVPAVIASPEPEPSAAEPGPGVKSLPEESSADASPDSVASLPGGADDDESEAPQAESASSRTAGEAPVPEQNGDAVQKPVAENSLFDLGELTVQRRESRRVIMSLYDEDAVQPVRTKRRPSRPERSAEASQEPSRAKVEEDERAVSQGTDVQDRRVDALEAEKPASFVAGTRPAVLGEVIKGEVHTFADTIPPPVDIATEIARGGPLGDLRAGLGVNDRFLLLRDLFDGDQEAFDRTMERLNEFDDLDDCMIYIAENFTWNPNSDGAKYLTELLERKLGR